MAYKHALEDPANKIRLNECAADLRLQMSLWQLEMPMEERPHTQTSPLLTDRTMDIMEAGFKDLVIGFADAEDKWGGNYTKNVHRRDARKAGAAVKLKDDLAVCPQVKGYVEGLIDDKVIEPEARLQYERFVAQNLMATMIRHAIRTAQDFGIPIPRVERSFF